MSETRAVSTKAVFVSGGAAVDPLLRVIELDDAFAALVGASPADLLGQPIIAYLPALATPLSEVLATGRPVHDVPVHVAGGGLPTLRLDPLCTSRNTVAGIELTLEPADLAAGGATPQGSLRSPSVRAVLDGLFAFAGVLHPDGTLIEANRAALEAASLLPHDVLGKHFADTFWWSYDPAVQARLRDTITCAAEGVTVRYDVRVRLAHDQFIMIDFMLAPARDAEGRVQYLIPSAIDISERTRAEAALRDRERHLSLALEAAQMGTWEIELQTQTVLRAPSTDRLFGLAPGTDARSMADYFSCIHPDDRARVEEAIRRTVEEDADHGVEYRVVWPDGSVRWLASRGELVRDVDGRPRRLAGALLDITARKEAEAALRESEARYSALAEAVPAILFTNQPDGSNDYISQNYYDFTGTTRGSGEGSGWLAQVHPDDRERTVAAWQASVRSGNPFLIEYRFRRHDGAYRWFRAHSRPLRDAKGTIIKWFGVCLDVDDAKRAAAEREALLARERAAVEARDSFIAVASHDLRSPLTVVLGQAELLERRAAQQNLPERIVRSASTIVASARRMNRMVGALLDLSRIESGKLTVDLARLDVATVVERCVAETRAAPIQHVIELVGETDGLWVHGDEVRLEQVFLNLLGNAVKYSPEGGAITMRLAQHDGQVCIAVTDQGLGIPAEAQPRLFERFYRAANADASGISGLGIGLYTVREILTMHGGSISVTSVEGGGSTFTVLLPLIPSNQHDDAPRP